METESLDFTNIYDSLKSLKKDWKYFDIESKQAALGSIVGNVIVKDKYHGELNLVFFPMKKIKQALNT